MVMGVLFATAAMMAQELGGRHYKGVRRTMRQGFWVLLSTTIPAWLYFANGEWILIHLLGQDPTLAAEAQPYLDGAMWGVPFLLAFNLLRNFIAAHSQPRPALWILIAGIAVNAVLDWVLMFGQLGVPRLELLGLGIATTLVHAMMFLALLVYVLRSRRYRRYHLLARFWRTDWPRFREIWSIGLPIALTKLAEAGLFAGSGFLVGWLGANALAGHAVALQYAAIAFMVPFGVAQAATVRVGLAVGRGDPAGARLAGWVAMAVGVLIMLPPSILFATAGEPLASLFLDLDDPDEAQAIAAAVVFLGVAGIFQLADGGQAVAAGVLRGFKDTRIPMVIAIIGYWPIGMGAALLLAFPLGLGGVGIWSGLALGLAIVWIALSWRYSKVSQRFADRVDPVARLTD